MEVVFANNQTLVAVQGTPTIVFTDPVALNGADRATPIGNVHSIFATGGSPNLNYQGQVSNDGGQNFVDAIGCSDNFVAQGVQRAVAQQMQGALIRFKYTLSIGAGGPGDIAACCFDLHVNLDHA